MWRPRDRERYIGAYDPEHEMPDPGRGPGDRWQSDAYRRGARDSRFAYRMNPDRFERHFNDRRDYDPGYDMRWDRDARDLDRGGYGPAGYGYGFRGGYGYDRDRDYEYRSRDYGSDWDRGYYDRPARFDRDRIYGADRGWDYDRENRFDDDRDRWDRNDRWRW
jgi:hypothetical protein